MTPKIVLLGSTVLQSLPGAKPSPKSTTFYEFSFEQVQNSSFQLMIHAVDFPRSFGPKPSVPKFKCDGTITDLTNSLGPKTSRFLSVDSLPPHFNLGTGAPRKIFDCLRKNCVT